MNADTSLESVVRQAREEVKALPVGVLPVIRKTTHDLVATVLASTRYTPRERRGVLKLFDMMHSTELNDEFHRGRHYNPPG